MVEVLSLFIFEGNGATISSSLLPIGYGNKVRVNIGKVKGVIIPGGMIAMCLGQVPV